MKREEPYKRQYWRHTSKVSSTSYVLERVGFLGGGGGAGGARRGRTRDWPLGRVAGGLAGVPVHWDVEEGRADKTRDRQVDLTKSPSIPHAPDDSCLGRTPLRRGAPPTDRLGPWGRLEVKSVSGRFPSDRGNGRRGRAAPRRTLCSYLKYKGSLTCLIFLLLSVKHCETLNLRGTGTHFVVPR